MAMPTSWKRFRRQPSYTRKTTRPPEKAASRNLIARFFLSGDQLTPPKIISWLKDSRNARHMRKKIPDAYTASARGDTE